VNREISVTDLSVSKTLKSQYKRNPPAHAIVAEKKRQRGDDVTSGDRVSYVQIIGGHRLATANVECPQFVADNGTPVDLVRIFDTQIAKPFIDLFEIGLDAKCIMKKYNTELARMQMPAERENLQKRQKMRSIDSYFAIQENT
jgi:DNA polymerase elongation subunit (family B)